MEPRLLHFPILPGRDLGLFRTSGPGLGNLLFPIGRALIGAQECGGRLVLPTIPQFKLGPIVRRERDKRFYFDEFGGRSWAQWRDWMAAQRLPKIDEFSVDAAQSGDRVIAYDGMQRWFHHLSGHHDLIRTWFDQNANYAGRVVEPYDIAVHVRLGDFAQADSASDTPSVRSSVDWFRAAIALAISQLPDRSRPRIMIFSDEDQAVVREMLAIPDAMIDPSRNAITAIRNLADAGRIVTSRSTFSMWGAFLNNRPAIWHEQLDLATYFPPREGLDTHV